MSGVAGIVDVAIVGGIAEWYWYYRNAPEPIKSDLSRSRRHVIFAKSGKLLLFTVLAAVPIYAIFGISAISSVVIYIVAVGILVVTSGNIALADLSRAQRKYRNLEQRVATITDDASARITVDITPPLETLSPKQYKSVDEAVTALENYEAKLSEVEEEHTNWKRADKKLTRLRKRLDKLDKTVSPHKYAELSEETSEFLLDEYSSSEAALADLERSEKRIRYYQKVSRVFPKRYKNIKKRIETIKEDQSSRVDVETLPPLETLSPDRYSSIDDTIAALEEYERQLKEVEDEYQSWKRAEKERTRLRKKLDKLDESVAPDVYSEFVDRTYQIDGYASGEAALADLKATTQRIQNYKRISRIHPKAEKLLDDARALQGRYPSYDFETFVEQAEDRLSVTQATIEDPASYRRHVKEGRELLDASLHIVSFLHTVDTPHPSIDAYRWRTVVNSALREYTARDLQPIVRKIDRLENALWRHENLYAYSWREFEELVGALYRSKGYQVTVTAGANDGGVDVWARNQSDTIAIQVKQYSHGNTVGRPDLQRIVSTLATGEATKVAVVTSSTFSSTAHDYAAQFGPRMELIDGDCLIAILSESSLPPPVTESQEQQHHKEERTNQLHGSNLPQQTTNGAVQTAPAHKYGSLRGHFLIAIITAWWSLGLGNVLYAVFKNYQYRSVDSASADDTDNPASR